MQKRVWTFKFKKDVTDRGADRTPWYVGWYDADGKRHCRACGAGDAGKKLAAKTKRRIQSELDMGLHKPDGKKKWAEFRAEYENHIAEGLEPATQQQIHAVLGQFQRIAKPVKMDGITTKTIDAFSKARRQDQGKKPGSTVSMATVNKDLRHLKAALRIAHEWKYLPEMPKVRMVREPVKLPTYVTPEHFATIYHKACPLARFPQNTEQHYSAEDWWKALVVTAYMTGLRIREILALRREDVDLDGGKLITRATDNKGKRDEELPMHQLAVEHVRRIVGFHPLVFRWCHRDQLLWDEFARIQQEAGIKLPCPEDHQHTPACHVYGFHDFRRAFATMNEMAPETLQRMMDDAAQELSDHAAVHQHGRPAAESGREPVRAGSAAGGDGVNITHRRQTEVAFLVIRIRLTTNRRKAFRCKPRSLFGNLRLETAFPSCHFRRASANREHF